MTRRLFLLAAVAAAVFHAEDFPGKVVATTHMRHNGASERSRLWWNDGPEMKRPFGTRAKQFTGDLAFGQMVTVKVRGIDRYKRAFAEIILPDGRNLNQELVRAGLALRHQQSARRELVLRDLEQEGRAAKRGPWSDLKPAEPWEWRKAGRNPRKPGICVNRRRKQTPTYLPFSNWSVSLCEIRAMSQFPRTQYVPGIGL